MKIVINKCYGGFSLSPAAVSRYAELKGRKAYFFKHHFSAKGSGRYEPISLEEAGKERLFFMAFDIPNPESLIGDKEWNDMTLEERQAQNKLYSKHSLDSHQDDRTDHHLIQVVEELGEKANGSCAELEIIEIPDGVEWELDEYDGLESVHEKHRSWG